MGSRPDIHDGSMGGCRRQWLSAICPTTEQFAESRSFSFPWSRRDLTSDEASMLLRTSPVTFTILSSDTGTVRASMEGDLDGLTIWDVRPELAHLLAMRPARVEIDLSALRHIDSCGVGLLVSFWKRLREQRGELSILGLRDQPLSILKLLRVDGLLASTAMSA
jgi:anti-sigma B factor antagonist